MTERDRSRLATLHGECAARMTRVLTAMEALGWPMCVTQALRTLAEQQALYDQGRKKPGPIVTNCDGVKHPSKHQSGRAVDCAFLDRQTGQPTWSEAYPWDLYGACVRAVGLLWGGDWKGSLVDRPHAELPPEVS